MIRYHVYQIVNAQRQAAIDARHFRQVCSVLQQHFGNLRNLRLLDLGHGSRFNQLLLFHSLGGVQAVGLDLSRFSRRPSGFSALIAWQIYYRLLALHTGIRLKFDGLTMIQGNALQLPFLDSSIDCVISNAVFEHLPDIWQVAREMQRVLAPHGLVHIGLHLWTSLSGSHHPQIVAYPLQTKRWPPALAPWFHLRGLPPYDASQAPTYGYQEQYLNRYREQEYHDAIAAALTITDWQRFYREGEELLQPELLRALHGYSIDELTTRSLRIQAVKRS
jgi:SAM-dependent methyltransferase